VLFNSLTFVVFFVLVLALHHAPLGWTTMFYAAWNPPFVILLWISTVIDWHVAKRLFVEQAKNRRRALLAVSVIVNLGLLGYFKYGEFLLENRRYFLLHVPDDGLLAGCVSSQS
jgi:alginate O-acetyltransferase complex protein AlgI